MDRVPQVLITALPFEVRVEISKLQTSKLRLGISHLSWSCSGSGSGGRAWPRLPCLVCPASPSPPTVPLLIPIYLLNEFSLLMKNKRWQTVSTSFHGDHHLLWLSLRHIFGDTPLTHKGFCWCWLGIPALCCALCLPRDLRNTGAILSEDCSLDLHCSLSVVFHICFLCVKGKSKWPSKWVRNNQKPNLKSFPHCCSIGYSSFWIPDLQQLQ